MIKANPTLVQQQEAVLHVNNTFDQYKKLLDPYYTRLLWVYKELNTFIQPKTADWSTSFKVNKMHEVSNKITPRIVSRNPKWIVSIKPDIASSTEWDSWELDMQEKAIRDLLSTTFDKYNLQEPVKLWAKWMVNYWPSFAKVKTKYDISRYTEKVDEEETYMDEMWVEQVRKIDKKIKEKVVNQYVTIEPVSWADIYYDPRYVLFSDMPAVVHVVWWVRLWDLKRNKEDYINIDLLDDVLKLDKSSSNYKENIQSVLWIQLVDTPDIDKNNLSVKFYYWLYDLKWDERLYKIGVVNGLICICFEEITQIPFEQIKCFEDTETNLSVWFLEPILGLQQELNYKKNSASEYINHSLNRSYIRSPNSWINPKRLVSKPNNIISTTKTVDEAMKNLQELPHREINPSYFQEQNDFERQIQGLTFTIDTNNSANTQWLTNTATGMRIKFFESNSVIDAVRKNFEQWLTRLAYKLLTEIAENTEDNITIKQLEDEGYREINKEAIMDTLNKYEITIETGTSSYDTLENRRDDAIAKGNIWLQYAWAWVPVNMQELFKDVLGTFEGTTPDKYIQKNIPIPWQPTWWGGMIPSMPWQPNSPEQIVEAVAKWDITAGV